MSLRTDWACGLEHVAVLKLIRSVVILVAGLGEKYFAGDTKESEGEPDGSSDP